MGADIQVVPSATTILVVDDLPVVRLSLRHILQHEGFEEGVHSEGAIWHTLFRLFFWDIIFCHHVEPADVWISSLQVVFQ